MSSQTGWPEGASAECGKRKPQRFAHHLRSRRRAEKLAAASRRPAGAATQLGRLRQRNQSVRKTHPQRLHRPGVLAAGGGQRHSAGDDHARQIPQPRHRHHHGRQPFVASRHAQHAGAQRQRARQPAEDHRRVIPIRQAVKHTRRPLRPPVARIGTKPGEGNGLQAGQLLRRRLHQQPDFPMPGMIAQRHRFAVRRAQTALRAQDQELLASRFRRVPSHARIERHPEKIAAGTVKQHFFRDRQPARRAGRLRLDFINLRRKPNRKHRRWNSSGH